MSYGRCRRCTRFTTEGSLASFARGPRSRLCNRSEHRPALLCVQGQSPFVNKASKMGIHSRTRVDMAVSTKVARPTVVNKLRRDARLGARIEYSDHIRRAPLRPYAHLLQLKMSRTVLFPVGPAPGWEAKDKSFNPDGLPCHSVVDRSVPTMSSMNERTAEGVHFASSLVLLQSLRQCQPVSIN